MMSVQQWVESLAQGRPKYLEKTCPSGILSTTNGTWPDPGSNPGHRGGKPVTNRLSYGKFAQDDKNCLFLQQQ
jgi:hypothetical protein